MKEAGCFDDDGIDDSDYDLHFSLKAKREWIDLSTTAQKYLDTGDEKCRKEMVDEILDFIGEFTMNDFALERFIDSIVDEHGDCSHN
jgi:hypothetical protein